MEKEESKFFSDRELKVLKTLGKKKMTLRQLSDKVFTDDVMNAQIMMATLVTRVQKKCKFHKLNWSLLSEGQGRAGKTVWLASTRSK